MEKPSKDFEEFTQKMIREAGVSKPSPDFTDRVMEAIAAKTVHAKVYRPLIARRTWNLLAIIAIVGLIGVYFLPVASNPFFENLEISQKIGFNFSFPEFKTSKTFTYALGFLALFLVQIPFLKHYVLKRYK